MFRHCLHFEGRKERMCWQRKSIRSKKNDQIRNDFFFFLAWEMGKTRVLIHWLILRRLILLIFRKIVGRAGLEVRIISLVFEILTSNRYILLESCTSKCRVQRGLSWWYKFESFQHKKVMDEITGQWWYKIKRF